ncbi:hypothetical protein DVH24_021502 [Malus domestica]|uniref:Uncharacterized protein n=1 Tax=Malus domestica TaxID=3750 RepID=A0A498JWD9_MALDO|nr:hypothetical protein DVH24_021502 [Malus domestica]
MSTRCMVSEVLEPSFFDFDFDLCLTKDLRALMALRSPGIGSFPCCMFNILLCDAELRLYELESLRVGLNLAEFGTRKTLDRSHQSTLLPLCYMISYIRYMLSPECLSTYCLLPWSTAGHAASGTAISSYKKEVEALQDINQSVEILVRLLSAVSGWSEKMFRYFIVLNL